MRLALLLVLSTLAVAHGFPSNLPSISSLEEHRVENQVDVRDPIVPTCVRGKNCDESHLHFITARAPRRGTKGPIASSTSRISTSRTSTSKSSSPPKTSIHPPSSSPTQDQHPTSTRARNNRTTKNGATSGAASNSALGVTAPSATTTTFALKSHRVSSKSIIVIAIVRVVVVAAVVIIALLLWRRQRAQRSQKNLEAWKGGENRGFLNGK